VNTDNLPKAIRNHVPLKRQLRRRR
jgi:hypothetical protein